MKEIFYVVKSEFGLHARPAGLLTRLAGQYQSLVQVQCEERVCDVKRMMSLMGMDIKKGEKLHISIEGSDEEDAYLAIQKFLAENL